MTLKNSKASPTTSPPTGRLQRYVPWLLVICSLIGIIASLAITMEKFELLKNPSYHPICNLNPIISCGSVMASKQANVFGFMNTYIGLLGFPVLLTIGMAMLAGARFKRWFWLGLEGGLGLGFVFAYWLLFESVYRIQALCPYCLAVDVVVTILFWYVSLFLAGKGWLGLPPRAQKLIAFMRRHHFDILILWFLIIVGLVLHHFWYYFGTKL